MKPAREVVDSTEQSRIESVKMVSVCMAALLERSADFRTSLGRRGKKRRSGSNMESDRGIDGGFWPYFSRIFEPVA